MIKSEQGGSMYDQFSDHEALQSQPKQREENWQANRPDTSKPYVNSAPAHSSHYDRKEQKNESKIAYWRMFSGQMPKGEFEQSVNTRFGGKEAIGADYRGNMPLYVAMYKQMMADYNNQ